MFNKLHIAGAVLLFLLCIHTVLGAPSVQERDTDKKAEIRSKLQRLHNLLSELEEPSNEEENDLQKMADVPPTTETEESTESEEDNVQTFPVKEEPDSSFSPRDREAVQVLARALAKLRQPRYNGHSVHGEQLRAEYNQQDSEADKKAVQLEDTIKRALVRLDKERSKVYTEENDPRQASVDRRRQYLKEVLRGEEAETSQALLDQRDQRLKNKFYEEALRLIEDRLVRDIALASKIGISVDNLIDDLEERAYKAAALKKIEEGFSPDRYGTYDEASD